ncbi:MAG: hypothetical protein WBL76_02390, partial [Bacteroidales bacterium]
MERQVGLFPGVKIHCFDYYMDQQILFADPEELNNPDEWQETVLDGQYTEEETTSIGRSKSTNVGGGASVNLGIGKKYLSKINTLGGNKNFSLSNLKDKVQLIDLNGDGIIDKLVRDGNNYNYYKGYLTNGKLNFNGPYPLNLPTLGKSWTFSNNTGGELYFGISIASGVATYTYTESKQYCNDYFADVNGDGYLDFVRDGGVYFNFPDINNIPHFTLNGNNNTVVQSADDTCYVIHYDGVLDSSVVIDTTETIENIDIKRDPVKMWIAPEHIKNRYIKINSQIQRISPQSDNSVIYYYVQHNDNIIMLDSILPTDMNMYTYDTCLYISRNDRIYFRMHSKDGGKVDDIYWDPEIIFGGGVYGDCNMPIEYKNDADEKHIERFKYSEDAIIHDKQYFIAPDTGTVKIDVSISSPAQSDSVRFQIIHNDTYLVNNGYIDAQPFSYANTIYRNVMPGDSLFFKLNSNTNINWNDIDFYAKISYIDITDIPDTVPNNPPIRTSHEVLDYVYYPSLHMSIYPRVVRHSYPYYLKKGRYIIEPQLSFKG